MKKKTLAIVLFLEESPGGSGIFHMKDYVVSGLESFVKNLDAFATKEAKDAAKKIVKSRSKYPSFL